MQNSGYAIEALTPRRGWILKHIIEEYVVTAQPVSSDVLVRKYVPSVSAATVRNEMAALEGRGYLYQPHTSAGRVPSDHGYRYYVESLMGGVRLPEAEERMISHLFHQVELDVHEWTRLAASVLSARLRNPVMVRAPVARVSRLRHLDMVLMSPTLVLLVLILQAGAVLEQVVRLDDYIGAEELSRLTNEWNALLAGQSAGVVRGLRTAPAYAPLLDASAHLLEEADRQQEGEVRVEGLRYIAGQPEFGTSDHLLPVVEAIESDGVLSSLVGPLLESPGLHVAIGHEQPLECLRECSVVLSRYGRTGEMIGVVAVLGPTRMPYWRAVPMVAYIAAMLDRLLVRTFLS